MTAHYVDIYPEKGGFTISCSCGSFYKKSSSRGLAHSFAHLHLAGFDTELLEITLAGKAADA